MQHNSELKPKFQGDPFYSLVLSSDGMQNWIAGIITWWQRANPVRDIHRHRLFLSLPIASRARWFPHLFHEFIRLGFVQLYKLCSRTQIEIWNPQIDPFSCSDFGWHKNWIVGSIMATTSHISWQSQVQFVPFLPYIQGGCDTFATTLNILVCIHMQHNAKC